MQTLIKLLVLLKYRPSECRLVGMSSNWMSAPWNRLGDCRLTERRLSDRYPEVTGGSPDVSYEYDMAECRRRGYTNKSHFYGLQEKLRMLNQLVGLGRLISE